jgi:hypothetical protein
MSLPRPPLNYDAGAFFSVTTYSADSWVACTRIATNAAKAGSSSIVEMDLRELRAQK